MPYVVERKPLTLSERLYLPQILAGMHRLYGEGHAITGSTSSRFSSSTVNQNCFKWHPFLGRASVGYSEFGNEAIVQLNWMVEGAPPQ